jgi:DNA-binding MarR family transcriptional regulator
MTKEDAFDLQGFLPYLLNQAAEASSHEFQRYYKERYGMLRTEWRVLFHLGQYGKLTAKDICERGSLHKTKVSRAVRALEAKRFITRAERPDDRRHEQLDLTKLGQAAYNDLNHEAARFDADLASRISQADQDVLRRCLRQIAGL